jgi:hypothetical protein
MQRAKWFAYIDELHIWSYLVQNERREERNICSFRSLWVTLPLNLFFPTHFVLFPSVTNVRKWKSNGEMIGSKAKSCCYRVQHHFLRVRRLWMNRKMIGEAIYIRVTAIESFLSNTFCIISFCSDLSCRWNCLSCRIRFISSCMLFTYTNNLAYTNHLPWYIAVIVVFSKSHDKCSKMEVKWRNHRV